jgi:peptidoglycan hydrolase CwlO-like protein
MAKAADKNDPQEKGKAAGTGDLPASGSSVAADPATLVRADALGAAAEVLRREAERTRAMTQAAQVLEDTAAVLRQLDEADKRLAAVKKELAAAQEELQKVLGETQETQEKCAQSYEEARRLIASEGVRAETIIADAKQRALIEAQKIISDATEQSKGIESTRIQRLDDLDAQIRKRNDHLLSLASQISDAEETVRATNERIVAARAAARAMMEGNTE